MLIIIQSCEPISGNTVCKVKDIFRESNCPNESLRNSIKNFKSLDDGVVQIGEGNRYTVEFDVVTKKSDFLQQATRLWECAEPKNLLSPLSIKTHGAFLSSAP